MAEAIDTNQSQYIRDIAPKPATTKVPEQPARKLPKSRHGCITCKAKRTKCDEAKPSCGQCARRKTPCGGYKMNIRWKMVSTQQQDHEQSGDISPPPISLNTSATFHAIASSVFPLPINAPSQPNFATMSTDPFDTISDQIQDTSNFPSACSDDTQTALHLPPEDSGISNFPMLRNFDWSQLQLQNLGDSEFAQMMVAEFVHPDTGISPNIGQLGGCVASLEGELLQLESPDFPSLRRLSSGLEESEEEDLLRIFQQPRFRIDSPEMVAIAFHNYTSNLLSISIEDCPNPWQTLIWPLAKEYPALYHAVAAMTCFYMSRAQPQLHLLGIQHTRESVELLALDSDVAPISMATDAALAATISLGFAETWDHQKSSTGIVYVKGARSLISQAVRPSLASSHSDLERTRWKFLIKTYIYMDVIARLSSMEEDPFPHEFLPVREGEEPTINIDPLMGYATTLFPVLGDVAHLVTIIRGRTSLRNSPAIISKAARLKRVIEGWELPVDSSSLEVRDSTASDVVQVAEAYRWAGLLLLQQAVPELPSRSSLGSLAQKILMFLATIPLSSSTTIVQIFPLLTAGCEAVDEEDREWVAERWTMMSRRMVAGIVEKFLDVTQEVWRRRDEHALANGLCPFSGTPRTASPTTSAVLRLNDFPISAAFNKGVDALTRSGCVDYTVRGRLHWLGVMKDHGWEVMLG
ncbi:hypothetical protein P154DRAFT_538219 [Amniculicola lignicola CBS 123094]|uniref:Zn(2)-C6 fungal-type domain-containing protein n=1 Tax=Amniculicola lignicola CBS 123094 TaxID=1392246 RepID=A0A6A5WAS4_9PLEO|nr:hypothetical protein P154DRAFT_538219 [Amniculicola lignicola CBS 123094]